MNKTVIIVGNYTREDLAETFYECCKALNKSGIPIIYSCMARHYIETEQCIIRFVIMSDPSLLRGIHGDICFYISDTLRSYFYCSQNGDVLGVSFIDYICNIEGRKE